LMPVIDIMLLVMGIGLLSVTDDGSLVMPKG